MTKDKRSHYDAIILGSGQAGNPLAVASGCEGQADGNDRASGDWRNLRQLRLHSHKNYGRQRRGGEPGPPGAGYGVEVGKVSVDMPAVRERKRGIVKKWREGSENRLQQAKLVDVIYGEGSFLGPKQVRVRLERWWRAHSDLRPDRHRHRPDGRQAAATGLESVPFLDNMSIMELDVLPEHLLVLGGGYVGLEFGQMFRRFGSRVTVIQHGKQLLTNEDPDIADEIAKLLREDGIEILLEATGGVGGRFRKNVRLRVKVKGESKSLEGTHLLVATGRKPNTDEAEPPGGRHFYRRARLYSR